MNITIRYEAFYHYEEKASLSPHIVRLFPRHDFSLQVNRTVFTTHASAQIHHRQDLFGNVVASCFYPDPVDELEFHLETNLDLAPKNAFGFLLEPHAVDFPFTYRPEEQAILIPYLASQQAPGRLPAALDKQAGKKPTVDAIVALNSWLHDNIAYERREEGDPYPPTETLERQRGSCRDFAVLMAEVLRHHGVAARLASGFLWEDDSPDTPRHAENALHAWVEAYLPGGGWIGLDPTNGVLCDHHFLPSAVGVTPLQITPVQGHYYGKRTIASTLDTRLSIKENKA